MLVEGKNIEEERLKEEAERQKLREIKEKSLLNNEWTANEIAVLTKAI